MTDKYQCRAKCFIEVQRPTRLAIAIQGHESDAQDGDDRYPAWRNPTEAELPLIAKAVLDAMTREQRTAFLGSVEVEAEKDTI